MDVEVSRRRLPPRNGTDVFRQGLERLKTNPWDVPTLRALALACQANHYNEVELRYLKNALDVNHEGPRRQSALRRIAGADGPIRSGDRLLAPNRRTR